MNPRALERFRVIRCIPVPDRLDQFEAFCRRHARRGVALLALAAALSTSTMYLLGPAEADETQVRRVESAWPETLALPAGMPAGSSLIWIHMWERKGLIHPWIERHTHTMIAAAGSTQVAVSFTADELREIPLREFQSSLGATSSSPRFRALSPIASLAKGPRSSRILPSGVLGDTVLLVAAVVAGFSLREFGRAGLFFRRIRRVLAGHCPRCKYPMPTDAAVCPECGEAFQRPPVR